MSEPRVALLSGASRGIGAAIAARLAADGWRLSLGLRRPEPPADPIRTHVHRYDALAGGEAEWVAAALARFGRVDAVIANAGLLIAKSVIEADDAEIDAMLAVNVKAPRRLVQAAWEPLAASGRGRVVILGSLSGLRVKSARSSSYAMTKHATVALAHGIRQAGWERGIRATAVCPGFVDTEMAAAATDLPGERMTRPDELAAIVATLLDLSNAASVATFAVNCQLEELF